MTCEHIIVKNLSKDGEEGVSLKEELTALLAQTNECYVLITCGKASKTGKMQVEMTYEGDPDLAAYLIKSAQDFL